MNRSIGRTLPNSSSSNSTGHNINHAMLKLEVWQVTDVADFLGYAVQTVYNKVNRGEIPYYKRGKLYFIPSEIITWLMMGGKK